MWFGMIKIFFKFQIFIVLIVIGSILNADPYSLANVSQYLKNLEYLLSLMLDRENSANKQDMFEYRDALKEF